MAEPINPDNVDDWDESTILDPTWTSIHTFSTDDITVTFDGTTVGSLGEEAGTVFDTTGTNGTKETKDGVTLYPIDSEFGYNVYDFIGADVKELDGDYAEGWAGNVTDGEDVIGLVISDSPTDTFKTPALLGTWLAGLGAETVKASTEHYVVMQNILSDQVTPGLDANRDGDFDDVGDIRPLNANGDPALYPLDNNLVIIGGDNAGRLVADVIDELAALPDGAGDINGDGVVDIKDVLTPNETQIGENIAVSTDYSVTLKDDGKLLYRWGNTIKKPNDVRLEATLDLPDEWSEYATVEGEDDELRPLYQVTAAELVVHHTITNNPNDQLRPEDYENEAATGTLPEYIIIPDYNLDGAGAREVWVTADGYYAGDGTFYPAGTILRDQHLADQWDASDLGVIGASDGSAGFTNAWYTTMNREPFEADTDPLTPSDSGPRWRLKSDKYGQDLPSVVIPIDPTDEPPPTNDEVKYEVGAETQTVINLLDWKTAISPLSISAGWQNKSGEVSINGVNYSNDFDLAVYIKGDVKPATIYSAELRMDYDEIPFHARGTTITGTEASDYLVGLGSNTFTGGAGGDLFVVSYGSSNGGALTQNTVTDFAVGQDVLGLIGLGVNDLTFDSTVFQQVVGDDLQIWVDRDGAVIAEKPVLVATLTGVDAELDLLTDILAFTPGAEVDADDEGGEPPPPPEPEPIIGTIGADVLTGTPGNDTMLGLAGNDYLYGLAGDDVLDGGAGTDRLFGGAGADVFVFADGGNLDFVYDFEDGVDLIQLDGLAFDDAVISSYRGGAGTQITIGDDRMILQGVAVADITEDDFIADMTLMVA
ncbi:MAG TPA: hypothetical protein VLA78_13605 [Paracoccaceae bacterium]|nr:hypothetical protein [Paracoccaceae bacterium]